jgi:hypothetical protein
MAEVTLDGERLGIEIRPYKPASFARVFRGFQRRCDRFYGMRNTLTLFALTDSGPGPLGAIRVLPEARMNATAIQFSGAELCSEVHSSLEW